MKEKRKHICVSVHFTTKGQDVKQIRRALALWLDRNGENELFIHDGAFTVHSCFLKKYELEKMGIPTDAVDMVSEWGGANTVFWTGATGNGLDADRRAMLINIRNCGGAAVFLGKIEGGVQTEYNMARDLGLRIIHIDVPEPMKVDDKGRHVMTWGYLFDCSTLDTGLTEEEKAEGKQEKNAKIVREGIMSVMGPEWVKHRDEVFAYFSDDGSVEIGEKLEAALGPEGAEEIKEMFKDYIKIDRSEDGKENLCE